MALRPKRPTGTDKELREQIAELEQERTVFLREHAGKIREDAHRGADVTLDSAREIFERRVSEIRLGLGADPLPPQTLVNIASLWAATTQGFADAFHKAIDEAEPIPGQPSFSALSRTEFEATLDKLSEEIGVRWRELDRREIERRRDEVEAELEALDEKVSA
jgi:hypothetical protein